MSEGGDSNKAHLRGFEPPRRSLPSRTDLEPALALAAIRSRSSTKQGRWDREPKTQGARRGELHNPNPDPSPEGLTEAILADLDGALRYLPNGVDGGYIENGSPEGVLEADSNYDDILSFSDISGV